MPQIIWRAVHFRKMSCDLGLTGKAPEIRGSFPHAATVSGRGECVAGAGGFTRRKRGEVRSMSRSRRRPAMVECSGGQDPYVLHSCSIPRQSPPGWARLPKTVNFAAAPTDRPSTSSCRAIFRCDHRVMPTLECLGANGFPEAAERIDQPHIHKELKDIADAARKQAVGLSTGATGLNRIFARLSEEEVHPSARAR